MFYSLKHKILSIFLVTVLFISVGVGSSFAAQDEIEEESGRLSLPGWFPKISGLLRYSIWWMEHVPFEHPESEFDRIFLWLDKDFLEGNFGYHFTVEYKHNKLGHYPREVWMEEGYLFAKTDFGTFKLGSVYTPFGLLWDHTYYGSLIYYKGYMLDADYGLLLEGGGNINEKLGLDWSLGYFLREDDLNGETLLGQGWEFLSRGERNTLAARLNPHYKLSDNSNISLGFSALTGEIEASEADRQLALAADAVYTLGPLTLTSEYVFYDQNYEDKNPTLRGNILLAEINLNVYKNEESKFLKNIALRYNYSKDYPDTGNGLGDLHLPAISFQFSDNFRTDFVYVHWKSGESMLDKSWRMVFHVSF